MKSLLIICALLGLAAQAAKREEPKENNGGLTRAVTDAHVEKYRKEIDQCYENRRKFIERLALARIVYRVVVSPSGKIVSGEIVSSSLMANMVEECVWKLLKGTTLPRPNQGKSVEVYMTVKVTPFSK